MYGGQPGQFPNQIARGPRQGGMRGPGGYQRGGGQQMNRQYNQGQQGGQQQGVTGQMQSGAPVMRNYYQQVLLVIMKIV